MIYEVINKFVWQYSMIYMIFKDQKNLNIMMILFKYVFVVLLKDLFVLLLRCKLCNIFIVELCIILKFFINYKMFIVYCIVEL